MRNTLKILPLMLGIMLFFTQCEKEALDTGVETMDYATQFPDCNGTQELWAGAGQNNLANGFLVGIVEWGIDGNYLYVRYTIEEEGWSLTQTHLWVGDAIADIPKQAPPGQFPNKKDHDFLSEYEYIIDISDFESWETLFVAAHAVVSGEETDYEALGKLLVKLPVEVDFTWKLFYHQPASDASYFDITINSGSWLNGVYEGWCADSRVRVGDNPRSGTVYYSYDDAFQDPALTPYTFDKPHNLPLVNWVINNKNDFIGQESPGGFEDDWGRTLYTLGDVQIAIWELLFYTDNINYNPVGGVGLKSEGRWGEIIAMAENNPDGLDYMPGCGEDLVLIIVQEGNAQPIFIPFPVPCIEETAWALGGNGALGNNNPFTFNFNGIAIKWGWFFPITCGD